MTRTTLTAGRLNTISWLNDNIVDWAAGGNHYSIDGSTKESNSYYAFNFDGSINTTDGQYAFIYQKLGTKGLLLKNGELLREINRSYYFAEAYEYPAAFVTVDEVTYLIHCPKEYCRLDFENVETGEIVTDMIGRDPTDVFHSRLEISPDGFVLMSKGWHWHPLDVAYLYDIKECLKNPKLLDEINSWLSINAEISTANFINKTKVLIGSGEEVFDDENIVFPPRYIAVFDIGSKQISTPVKVNGEFGNLFAIDDERAWDTYLYPKIISLKTGDIIDKDESVYSGKQNSSIVNKENLVQIVFNRDTKQLAIAGKEVIEVFTP
ncbi:hypothetical protein [Mucilaginibacter ginsenosidivorax]|uniref:Uncharacterized protein n=1 Tax=Mucilaginibacter ginsenosidivorax TaxID=862126 RepID=A0A5B8W700_9SPHI|nr:hypothetical protein [Mucilaginibacter ginsenosidivorax]QEC78662.1 hypothetical protein FSB76_22940 [Mucilaginibacter ginsenosidivorax]